MKKEKNYLSLSFLKKFFRAENYHFYSKFFVLIIPIFLQSLMESLVNLIDNFMVGTLSDQQALNGVGTTVSIYNTVFFLSLSWSIAGGIYLSQYIGKRDKEMSKRIFSIQLILALGSSLICTILSLFFPKEILKLFFHNRIDSETGDEQKILRDGAKFLRGIALTFPLLTYSMISFNAIYVTGNARMPFFISLISLIINIILDPILMLILKLGFIGAAIGTLISRIIEVTLITVYFLKKKPIFFFSSFKEIKFKFDGIKRIMFTFLPVFIGEISFSGAVNAQIFIMYRYGGTDVLTATVINFTIMGIFYSIFTACSASVPYFVGRYLGRNMQITAKANAKRLIQVFSVAGIAIVLLGLLSADLVPFLFQRISPTAVDLSQGFIRFQSIAVFGQILTFLFYSVLRAGKKVFIVTTADVLTMGVLVVGGSGLFFVLLTQNYFSLPALDGKIAAKYVVIYISLVEIATTLIAYLLYKIVKGDKNVIS